MNPIEIIFYSTPLAIAAIGEVIGQKSGVINIGLEGMILAGAYGGLVGTLLTNSPWTGLLVGTTFGLILGLLQLYFVLKLALDQVLVGTAINLLALGVTSTLFRKQFGQAGQLTSLPSIPSIYGIDVVMLFCIALIPMTWWLLTKSRWGLLVRAGGEYPAAVKASGNSVIKLRFQACIIAALLAGLGGAYLSCGVASSFTENMSAGRGLVAIALVTFGRWKPTWVWAAALLIGFCEALQFKLQTLNLNIPTEFALALPYIAALSVLIIVGKGSKMPASLALPYKE